MTKSVYLIKSKMNFSDLLSKDENIREINHVTQR